MSDLSPCRLPLCALLLLSCGSLAAAQFDPADRQRHEQVTALEHMPFVRAYYCGHCPGAAKWMENTVKHVHDLIDEQQLPIVLQCITPDHEARYLSDYAHKLGMKQALFYHDPQNAHKISTKNIHQAYLVTPSGTETPVKLDDDDNTKLVAFAEKHGKYRFGDFRQAPELVQQAWWLAERGQPGVVAQVVQAAGKSGAPAELVKLSDALQTSLTAEAEALVAAEASIETLESLERLLTFAEGVELDAAEDRLKELFRDKSLKDELVARQAYQKCIELHATGKVRQMKQAAEGFAQIQQRFPATRYGQLAADQVAASKKKAKRKDDGGDDRRRR